MAGSAAHPTLGRWPLELAPWTQRNPEELLRATGAKVDLTSPVPEPSLVWRPFVLTQHVSLVPGAVGGMFLFLRDPPFPYVLAPGFIMASYSICLKWLKDIHSS